MTSLETFAISTGGSKHDNAPKLGSVTWRQFVARFAKPKIAACTIDTCGKGEHVDYDKDGKPRGCKRKDAGYYVPATFTTGRKQKDVKSVTLLVVDIDHLPDDDALRVTLAKLERYRYVVHATHSDRDGDRCVRIIIPMSQPVALADWKRFWTTAMATLGMPADPSCCDASQIYYWPARPSDADYFYEVHDGEALDVLEIAKHAPAEGPRMADNLGVDGDGVVTEGKRHAMLVSTAGALRARGAGESEILSALVEANRRCSPPKGESELRDVAKWASEQPIGEKWAARPPADQEPAGALTDEDFQRDEKGSIYKSQANIAIALRKLGARLTYDEFADQELANGEFLDDARVTDLWLTIDREFGFRPQKNFFQDVVSTFARACSFHPVRDYLAGLKWDGKPRLRNWLATYAGARDTEFNRAVGRLVLIAAVRRVRQPGCKFDEMLILESGLQGTNKSTALGILAVREDWFVDDYPLGANAKLRIEYTSGRWIVEAGELKGLSKGDVNALKGDLSRQVDQARLSYGRKPTRRPRHFIIVGTTNETADYLKDTTGNRRFWPVAITKFDLDALRRDRDQIWAEAAFVESTGESIRLDPSLYGTATEIQESRRIKDSIEECLEDKLAGRAGKIRSAEIWAMIGVEPGKATPDQNARVGAAMRKLGWEKCKARFGAANPENAYVKAGE